MLTISRHPFDPRCPWDGGAKNHIQLDLADMARVQAEMPRLRDIVGDGLDALINNAAISPKRADGGKIPALEMAYADWLHIFNVNFFACVALVQGLRAPLGDGARDGGQHDLHRRVAGASVRLGGLCRVESGALGADPRAGGRSGARRRSGERGVAWRNRHRHPVAGTETIVERDIPLHRLGKPRDVADLLLFLCSNSATYISGSEIHIDGGQRV